MTGIEPTSAGFAATTAPACPAIAAFEAPIVTARLRLRRLRPGDAPALHVLFSHWPIVQWLSGPRWPNGLAETETFLAGMEGERRQGREIYLVIEHDGRPIGGIDWRMRPGSHLQAGVGPNIGYWLAQASWGKGLMSEAAAALCDHIFDVTSEGAIYSGAFAGNVVSLRVQEKIGFVEVGETMLFSNPRGLTLPHVNTLLTRAKRAKRASRQRSTALAADGA